MKYLVGIGYVNRLDLLHKAVDSIKCYWPHTIIIDNSENHDLRKEKRLAKKVSIFEPPVPFSVTQMFNYMQIRAMKEGCDAVFFFHNDAECPPGVAERFLQIVSDWHRQGRKWGVAFTNYDILCAINLRAVREVGMWDTILQNFGSDCEYYRNMRMAGYESIITDLPVKHHGGQTTKSEPYRQRVYHSAIKLYWAYYKEKWGGYPSEEIYDRPFNR